MPSDGMDVREGTIQNEQTAHMLGSVAAVEHTNLCGRQCLPGKHEDEVKPDDVQDLQADQETVEEVVDAGHTGVRDGIKHGIVDQPATQRHRQSATHHSDRLANR